ncbi:hypothetical protein [Desulfobacca acetoxidans]|uniref:DUF1640 domain-containing protein n=1 Tax=Desulfobacca acetoxidans (strain ATCC 700848 / DSM 11109 / ASRB2) TaxID=880072 RepID=F2NJH9_DESAR|nr:hypothetical protein [Desulfobacca acetoxidans]AEB09491.1 hypothetical protein Desac_1643 [Desulfobacca acetoxidans DSM 11109]
MLTYQQAKDIEDALGPQQAPNLAAPQDVDRLKKEKQLAAERSAGIDIRPKLAQLESNLALDISRLEMTLQVEVARINGDLKTLCLWIKVLIALTIFGIVSFSPVVMKLLEMLK